MKSISPNLPSLSRDSLLIKPNDTLLSYGCHCFVMLGCSWALSFWWMCSMAWPYVWFRRNWDTNCVWKYIYDIFEWTQPEWQFMTWYWGIILNYIMTGDKVKSINNTIMTRGYIIYIPIISSYPIFHFWGAHSSRGPFHGSFHPHRQGSGRAYVSDILNIRYILMNIRFW